ncbi:MAG: hypothetical protein JRH11_11285, partial [Deltaproteobacteria bacterium]|nr:hypothetical protein [Deltaproteobacteria bacterium]
MRACLALIVMLLSAGCGLLLDPDPPATPAGDAAVPDASRGTCLSDVDCGDCDRCTDGICVSRVGERCTRPGSCLEQVVVCEEGERRCEERDTAPAGTVCRVAVDACDAAERCDGLSQDCPGDVLASEGTPCPGGTCGSAGVCNTGCIDGAPCDTGYACEEGVWACLAEAGPACVSAGPASAGTECRAPAGECDLGEFCDGSNAECPPDELRLPTDRCRPEDPTNECDLPEFCDGETVDCPPDGDRMDVGTACSVNGFCQADGNCRDGCAGEGGPCDLPGDPTCERGVLGCSAGVPYCGHTTAPRESGAPCRAQRGRCDVPDLCDGVSIVCGDQRAPAGLACREAAGPCDAADHCNGTARRCPNDFEPSGVECRATADVCDTPELCTGASARCPADAFEPAGTTCNARPFAGACDAPDECTGGSAACPDLLLPAGTTCGPSTSACVADAVCSGADLTCPPWAPIPDGTSCGCGVCMAGACTSAMPASVADCRGVGSGNHCCAASPEA